MKVPLILASFSIWMAAFGQDDFTSTIKDSKTKEAIPHAHILSKKGIPQKLGN